MAHRPRALARRDDRGTTTVEYVGIVALAAILVTALFTLNTPVKAQSKAIIDKAFCKIGSAFGGVGCNNADLPTFIPKDCQISSTQKEYGGSVSIVVTVGGDTGYTMYKIRTRQDDGSYKDQYVVKTNGKLSGSVDFGGADASVDTGSGGAGGGSPKITVEGSFASGSNYSFDNQTSAQTFVDKYKDQWGALGGEVGGAPKADSTYYELGGKAEASGEEGPLKGKASGAAVLGLESFKNGDKKYSLALTASAALDLGIPVPKSIMEASAHGDASVAVEADVTFDKNGNLKTLAGSVGVTAQADAGLDFADVGSKTGYQGKHRAKSKTDLEKLELPNLPHLQKGASAKLNFSTNFNDPGRAKMLGDALGSVVTGGSLTSPQKAAITDQINTDSQVTFNLNNYKHDEEKIGGKVHLWVVSVGAEGHINTTQEDVVNGWYYDPVQNTWQQNIACGGGGS